jgi:SAM-dependent methyltransferase
MNNATAQQDEDDAGLVGATDSEVAPAGGRKWISAAQAEEIAAVDHFRSSEYRSQDLDNLLDSYVQNFVEPLIRLSGSPHSVADIGAGYGWLAIAFALRTDAKVFAIEYDSARLAAARKIADILGVAHRMEWLVGSIADIPLPDRSVDAVYCVEVIEHTGVERGFVRELARITRDVLVITTPNKVFPIIAHDTMLPFCHWLPLPVRNVYASVFGRRSLQHNNLFWSPSTLLGAVQGFSRVSRFFQFGSHQEYRLAQRALAPRTGLARSCLALYFALVSKLGVCSIFFLPNLASTFRRHPSN